ncbi:MAG: hypothetical protein R3E96_17035, partial [Planctomycetota bacterium]
NCPAHRGVDKARIAETTAFQDREQLAQTGERLARILDDFEADQECAQVTCLYNRVNWWLEACVNDDRPVEQCIETGPDGHDTFL